MTRRPGPSWLCLLLILPGCLPETETSVIPSSPFGNPVASTSQSTVNAPPATQEAATKVGVVGQKIMCANPGLGIQPKFMTLGKEGALELFHDSSSNIYITETLARQCKTEGELAALLSTEIGRIVSERAAVRLNDVSDRGPPPAVDVGNDHGGSFGPADGVRMMERAKYERDRKLAREQAVPPPPDLLARAYLQKAGYNSSEMDAVAPLLRAADGNSRLEKLMTITPAKLPGT